MMHIFNLNEENCCKLTDILGDAHPEHLIASIDAPETSFDPFLDLSPASELTSVFLRIAISKELTVMDDLLEHLCAGLGTSNSMRFLRLEVKDQTSGIRDIDDYYDSDGVYHSCLYQSDSSAIAVYLQSMDVADVASRIVDAVPTLESISIRHCGHPGSIPWMFWKVTRPANGDPRLETVSFESYIESLRRIDLPSQWYTND
ncbi:unnamed protein product [Somion occarium]|uniref:Uncharacterized protein n=1 Tax=Somion occarium TaxID=3059160 RepID=A0ABP1E0M2_9APHY